MELKWVGSIGGNGMEMAGIGTGPWLCVCVCVYLHACEDALQIVCADELVGGEEHVSSVDSIVVRVGSMVGGLGGEGGGGGRG